MNTRFSCNRIAPYMESKSQRRLFDVYAETKSVKDVSCFSLCNYLIVYPRRCSVHVSGDCQEYHRYRIPKRRVWLGETPNCTAIYLPPHTAITLWRSSILRLGRFSAFVLKWAITNQTLVGHPRTPWAVKFHPRNPDILVSGCIGSTVIVWDWKKSEAIAYTQIMQNVMISSLDWHPKSPLSFPSM